MPVPSAETSVHESAGLDPIPADTAPTDNHLMADHANHDCPRFRLAAQYIEAQQ
jgi:hypothetical protein